MSENTSSASESKPDPASLPKPKKRRTWKQRIKLTVLVVLILAFSLRIAINILLPTVLRKIANAYDLDCAYGAMDLSLLGGNADIWNLTLRPKSGGDSIVSSDYIQGKISILNLLRGRLVVYRAEVDGMAVLIDREPDGSIPLLKNLLSAKSSTAATQPAKSATLPQQINLQSPFQVDAVRLSHITTRLRDRSVSPAFDATIRTTVRLSDVGSLDRPAQFEVQVDADSVLDALLVQGEVHNTPTSIDANMDVFVRGLHPKAAAGYLLPMGLKPVADDVTVSAKLKLTANALPNSADVSANMTLENISAKADAEEAAALSKLTLDVKRLNASIAELGTLLIDGARATVHRSAAGGLSFAGLELAPAPIKPAPQIVADQTPTSTLPGFRFDLDEIRLNNLRAAFDDQTLVPATQIAAVLNQMSIKNIVFDPSRPDEKVLVNGSIGLPGILKNIQVAGSATPFAAKKQFDLKVVGDGIKPVVLDPYLRQLGIESQLSDGQCTGDLNATGSISSEGVLAADARIENIHLRDGNELLSVNSAAIDGVVVDAVQRRVAVKSIQLSGPAMTVRRDKGGRLSALGMRTLGGERSPSVPAQPISSPTTATAIPTTEPVVSIWPRMELGQFTWKDIKLSFIDETVEPASSVAVGDAGVEVSDLVLDLQSKQSNKPGTFKAWLSVPKVVDQLGIAGTFAPGAQSVGVTLSLDGKGITGMALAPYVKDFGFIPTLNDGEIHLDGTAGVSIVDGALTSSLSLKNAVYKEGPIELAGVDEFAISALAYTPSGIKLGDVKIDGPRARIVRNAEGTLEAGGIRMNKDVSQPVASIAPTTRPAEWKLPPSPIQASMKSLHLQKGALTWQDNATKTPVNATAHANVDIDGLVFGSNDAKPSQFKIQANIDGVVGAASITGTLNTNSDSPAITLDITADGLRAGSAAAYFPPGFESTLKNGHFSGSLNASASNNPDGGLTADVGVQNIDFNDGSDAALFKLGTFKLAVTRIDPVGNVIAIDELSAAGLEANVSLDSDGTIRAGGLQTIKLSEQPKAPASNGSATVDAPPTTQAVSNVMSMVADARKPLPLFSIAKLDLGVSRLSVSGLTGPDAAPTVLQDLRLRNAGKIEIGGSDFETRPPVALQVTGGVAPIIGTFAANVRVMPLIATPTLSLDLDASEINGTGLTDLLPQLKTKVNGTGLTQGTFHTHLDATMNYGRHGPRDFDVSRGFTVDFDVKPVEFRTTPQGPIVAGLDEIRSDGIKVEPLTGNVRIKSLEITKPTGRVTRNAQGINAFGMVLPLAAQPATLPTSSPQLLAANESVQTHSKPASVNNSSPALPPNNEIALDRLTVSGIDVVIEDETSTPKTVIPFSGLDVDVRDVSNQMPFTGKPARFSVLLTSDKIPLPLRVGATPGVPASQPQSTEAYTESRELFSQITAAGKVAIKPSKGGFVLDGWAKTGVNGFELLGVRGLAKQYGVTIGGGVFDDFNDIRFNPSGNIETKNKLVLTNLSLTEPANGPIQRALKISAPIDVAIGLVTDPDGSITLQLPVPVKNGSVTTGDIVGPAIGAVAGVLTTAIASAPVKAVSGIGDLLGMHKDDSAHPEAEVVIPFLPGYAELDQNGLQTLRLLMKRMQKEPNLELQIRHELSTADVARAGIRVNPSIDECLTMAAQQREEKAVLINRRIALAGQAKGELGSRPESAAKNTLDELKLVDQQIAQIENTLDQLYDLTRPGAARQSDRRTRAASLNVGQDRLTAVRNVLVVPTVLNADGRVHQTNPQFIPIDSQNGGQVIISLIPKKE